MIKETDIEKVCSDLMESNVFLIKSLTCNLDNKLLYKALYYLGTCRSLLSGKIGAGSGLSFDKISLGSSAARL